MPAAKKMDAKPGGVRPTVASLAAEVADLRARIETLESGKPAEPAEPEVEDLSGAPVVLVMISRNTVEVVHANVPKLKVVVHDQDVVDSPSVVQADDKNRTGVLVVKPTKFSNVAAAVRDRVRDLGKVELPK